MLTIDLPFPPAVLSPNSRTHWKAKAKAVKRSREDAWLITKAAMGTRRIAADRLSVTLTFAAPSHRRFDADNLLGRAKAYLDGIADAIGIDDHKFDIAIKRAEPVKNGNVRVEIEVGT